jgi:ankyrin repeat protein
LFIEACRYGYLDIIQYIAIQDKTSSLFKNKNGEGFKIACACGRLEVVRYLLTSKDLKNNIDIEIDNNAGLRWACEYNQLEVVEYLLTSSELSVHANISASDNFGFIKACEEGYLDIVQLLLENKNLKQLADLNARDDYAFRFACKNEHKEVVRFLLNISKILNKPINVYAKNSQVIKELLKEKSYEMLEYLIVELKLFEIQKVKSIIKNDLIIKGYFETRV